MDFRILGPLEVLDEGRAITLGGSKQRALLALLLLHANETLSTDRLIDELWGERPPANAAKTVQMQISRLRKALAGEAGNGSAGVVVTRERGYELRLDPERLDSHRFERLVAEGRSELAGGHPSAPSRRSSGALSLWRGAPLAELAYEPFAQREIARLDDLRVAALEQLIEAKLALGAHAEVVGQLETLIGEHPYRERLRAQLMLALYRSDRQADALQAYQDARRTLVEELGIEPGERLRELERAILAQDPRLHLAAEEPAAAEPAVETPRSAFVGRERELAELVGGLDDAFAGRGRLFLLAGEPGIGKSRLAEELIAQARARGARVLVGRCWEAGGAPAYWPWVQSLRPYLRDTDAESLRSQLREGAADVARLLPELRDLLADLPPAPPLESEGARFRLFDSMTAFLKSVAAARPLVLVLDDLHAADEPSLLLLQFVARELGESRLLDRRRVPRRRSDPGGSAHDDPHRAGSRAGHANARARRPRRGRRRPLHRARRARRVRSGVGPGGARRDRGQPSVRRRDRAAARRGETLGRAGDGAAGDPAEREGGDRPPSAPSLGRVQPAAHPGLGARPRVRSRCAGGCQRTRAWRHPRAARRGRWRRASSRRFPA